MLLLMLGYCRGINTVESVIKTHGPILVSCNNADSFEFCVSGFRKRQLKLKFLALYFISFETQTLTMALNVAPLSMK